MPGTLFVAAGGGGDALAALIIRRADGADPDCRPLVAGFSWDRYILDPTPGPRSASDFEGLIRLSDHVAEVTGASRLRTGGTSGLSVLARHTDARFFLLDPADGVVGLRRQLADTAALLSCDSVTLVDIGGDVAADGNEPDLASPLADSLALAAVADEIPDATVVVGGPGLDGELSSREVRAAMARLGGRTDRLTTDDVRPYAPVLDHHPSEATALLCAAALGVQGRVEIRDRAALVSVGTASADVLRAPVMSVRAGNRVAQALKDSRSLAQAEQITRDICGRTELDHERRKASLLAAEVYRPPDPDEIRARIAAYRPVAAGRGATLVSLRRLCEVAGLRTYEPDLIRAAVPELVCRGVPLCRLG